MHRSARWREHRRRTAGASSGGGGGGGGGGLAAAVQAAMLADAPALLWKTDIAPADGVIPDLSGNNRPGTLTSSAKTVSSPGILGDADSLNYTVDTRIERAHEAWMNTQNFVVNYFFSFTNFASQRELMGKVNLWQVWIETTGKLTMYMSPPWTSVLSTNAYPAATLCMITVKKTNTVAYLYKNGVLNGQFNNGAIDTDASKPISVGRSSISPGGRYAEGKGNYFGYYDVLVSDARIAAWAAAAGL